MSTPVVVVKGSDPILVGDATIAVVAELLGERDRNECVDEFAGDDYDLGDALLAASSVSMFGDRIVVTRNAARFTAADVEPVLRYLEDPNPTSTLVIVWERPVASGARANPMPKKLADAVKAAGGEVRDSEPPRQAKARTTWLAARLGESNVRFDASAKALIEERLGEDVQRVGGLVSLVDSSFPPGSAVSAADIDPLLGAAGSVPPWELTDSIERGDVKGAITKLQRMTGAGDRHPLQIMATLQTHYERLLRLDGSGVRSETEAAQLLGMKGSTFPAKKALDASRRMGSERIAAAVSLLAKADVDLRGATAQSAEVVMEVAVGRLARLSGRR